MSLSALMISIFPSLLVAMFMACFNRAQKRRDERTESRAAARKKESMLGLEMQFASAKLSCAVAKAMQDGKVNGEVKEGIEAYAQAKKKYINFLNEQATENIYK